MENPNWRDEFINDRYETRSGFYADYTRECVEKEVAVYERIDPLKGKGERILIVDTKDNICEACSGKRDGYCQFKDCTIQETQTSHNDRGVAKRYGVEIGHTYTLDEIRRARDK